ncbi:MAG TPA: MFS transporter [Candidatus Saccharimonadales bacterium]|nr:MFS transporter [Candidatus Saccharimonadales bacterium]
MASARRNTGTRFLIMLGLPSLGLTFAVTTLSAYLPDILHDLTNPIVIGLIIGAEGFFGLFMPIIFGGLSDRAKKVGGRLKYLVPAVICMASALIIMGLIKSLWVIGMMVAVFYIGYYAYLAPFWAIYPDLIPASYSGRSRSAESIWRGVGAVTALVGSGFLLSLWKPLPFIVSAGLVAGVTVLLSTILGKRLNQPVHKNEQSIRESFGQVWTILRQNPSIRNLVIANSLWNATLRSILAFTVLFFTVGLSRSHSFVSGVIFPVAAIGLVVMIPLAGKLADSFGYLKVLTIAILIYGLGDIVPGITQRSWVIFIIPIVSGAAATVMVLPYAFLMRLLNNEAHGIASGLFGVSRGAGSFLGPLLTGIAISVGKNVFHSTHGYAAFWWAAGIYVLASLFFLRRIHEV